MSIAEPVFDAAGREPSLFWQRLRRNRAAIASALILVTITTLALLAPVFETALGIDATLGFFEERCENLAALAHGG